MTTVIVNGIEYAPKTPVGDRVSIYGVYDCHLFHRITGETVEAVIKNWLGHNSHKHPATVDGVDCDDLGPSMLCPAIVLHHDKELRRVGKMVQMSADGKPRSWKELNDYKDALLKDPDIPRLLMEHSKKDSHDPRRTD